MSGNDTKILEIDPELDALVNDVKYNYCGSALACGSVDGILSVLRRSSENDRWKIAWKNKAHSEEILQVAWAPPEFGQIIATLSADRSIKIWGEEKERRLCESWIEMQVLNPPDTPFTFMKFVRSKNFEGLISLTLDGTIHIYYLMNTVIKFSLELRNSLNVFQEPKFLGEYYCATTQSPDIPLIIAIACKSRNVVKLIRAVRGCWIVFTELNDHKDAVLDMSWAHNIGFPYETIATGCADGHVRIYKLTATPTLQDSDAKIVITLVGDHDDHKSKVHQVDWNYMGTVLSTVGEDGRILQWKSSILREWSCFSVIYPSKVK